MLRLLCLALSLALSLAASPALAQGAAVHAPRTPTGDLPHHFSAVALKFISLSMPAEPGSPVLMGPGVLYEFPIAHDLLELEFAGAILFGEQFDEIPVDVLVKWPIHLSHHVDLFAGLGPILTWVIGHEVGFGVIASLGGYYWLDNGIGILLEADYELLREGANGVQGIEAAAGVAYRF